ncbi:MAG: hypothetical protein AYK18_09810 [Theionarchaea archaeon DG-70]|nr:MAG: hypothetical protein AYK18_09810 [Theionarchaea archaeon DG-70]
MRGKQRKKISPKDLCFDIRITPGRRDSKPLMIVTFREAGNYDPEKHEWVPKLSELEFIAQTLKRVSIKTLNE